MSIHVGYSIGQLFGVTGCPMGGIHMGYILEDSYVFNIGRYYKGIV